MEKLIIDSGIREYQINDNGVLRFTPSDPNVYARFLEVMEKIQSVEEKLVAKAKALEKAENQEGSGAAVLKIMAEADRDIKQLLAEVFGEGNDFDKLLGGVNLLAVAGNGERVITNFLTAMQPIMVAGAESCAKQHADKAVAEAKIRRTQRKVHG